MRSLLLTLSICLLLALPACAADILIVQSIRSQPMEQLTRLVQNGCASNHRTLVMSDYAEFDLGRMVREERPTVLVAIGNKALKAAKKIRKLPVVYAMATNVDESSLANNVSGVSTLISPQVYLNLFSALELHKVGIIDDGNLTRSYLRRAAETAGQMGIELITMMVGSPGELSQRLDDLHKQSIDALWLIPNSVGIAPETVNSYFNFAGQNGLPVIGFSSRFLPKGALAALEPTYQTIGRQICNKVIMGRQGNKQAISDIPSATLNINKPVAEKLGITVPLTTLSSDG